MRFIGVTNDWHDVTHEDECFFLRVYGPGDYRFKGADLGILVTKGRMQTEDGLTKRCRSYIDGIRAMYVSEPLPSTTRGVSDRLRQVARRPARSAVAAFAALDHADRPGQSMPVVARAGQSGKMAAGRGERPDRVDAGGPATGRSATTTS